MNLHPKCIKNNKEKVWQLLFPNVPYSIGGVTMQVNKKKYYN